MSTNGKVVCGRLTEDMGSVCLVWNQDFFGFHRARLRRDRGG